MKYKKLQTNQQKEMLNNRMAQLEGEHFNHTTNLALFKKIMDTNHPDSQEYQEAAVGAEQAEKALKTIDAAYASVSEMLEKTK